MMLQLVKFPGQWKGTRWQNYEMYGAAGIRAALTKRWNKAADSEEIPTYNAIVHFLILHKHNPIIFWLHFFYNPNYLFICGFLIILRVNNDTFRFQQRSKSSRSNIFECMSNHHTISLYNVHLPKVLKMRPDCPALLVKISPRANP